MLDQESPPSVDLFCAMAYASPSPHEPFRASAKDRRTPVDVCAIEGIRKQFSWFGVKTVMELVLVVECRRRRRRSEEIVGMT